MSSNLRRGHIPRPSLGISEHLDEIYTIKGFFGDWAHLYRRRNTGFPVSWSSDELMYWGIDTNRMTPSDESDPNGASVELIKGDGITVSLSHRSQAMPFAAKNCDRHQIRFYHRGACLVETELGHLDVEPGDFVVIPKGLVYRESPRRDEGNVVVVFETAQPVIGAEAMWDSVGFTSHFVDYSAMKLPEPVGEVVDVTTEVRVKFRDRTHTMTYDFDPCTDVVGWIGDPIIYSLNVWDIPSLGSSHGFLPPPSGAVLMAQDKSFFFNVIGPKPFPNAPAPAGSYGAPAHLNDYDEVWFNHAAADAPDTVGHLWLLPTTIPHPGLKRPPAYPDNPVQHIHEMKLNFDTSATLEWTDVARTRFLPDPQYSLYTSMAGTHIGVVPEDAKKFIKH